MSKNTSHKAQVSDGVQTIDITVDGGYSPDQIVVQAGQPVRLNFLRKDPSSCLEQIILPDFRKSLDIPLN
ncbi:MAG: cupredoxin domain-containing protein [Phormidesmis sp.]